MVRAFDAKGLRKRADRAPFGKLNFHDDALRFVEIHPGTKRKGEAKITFGFRDYGSGKPKVLSFHGCANLRCVLDFDVLADNWFAQTEGVAHLDDPRKMEKFVHAQTTHWHTRYMPPMPKDKPVRKKLASIRKFHLFKITFFGGTFEVLAKRCVIKTRRAVGERVNSRPK
jgi:hypothetical protein